jgi:hypothetical protein
MNVALRHRCRNLHCRMKLKAPVENERHAFCCRGCFNSFYRSRCLVCEKDISLDPLTGERRDRSSRRKFCGRKCKAEAVKFPHTYQHPTKATTGSRSARFTGLKSAHKRILGPAYVLDAEVWGGRIWQPAISSGGVAIQRSRIRPRALVETFRNRPERTWGTP